MANELKFYLSGGTSNTNPFLSIGGAISNTPLIDGLLNNLWPDVSEIQARDGLTDHKIIYVKNVSGGALTGLRVYFGKVDQFIGVQLTTATTVNATFPALSSAADVPIEYYSFWSNIAEGQTLFQSLNDVNKRVVLYIALANSSAYNQFPDKVEVLLKKTGSPTGNMVCKVWYGTNTTDDKVARTIGTTFDVSTLTTTATKITFTTPTDLIDPILPSIAWRIGVEYTGGTASNHVDVMASTVTNDTYHGAYLQGWNGTKWSDITSQWPAMNLWTNTGPCFQPGTLPPPGSGSPPPGNCGGVPLETGDPTPPPGGGGGAEQHGYPITAATDNGNDGNVPTNAIDRKLDTRWSHNGTDGIITFDLGSTLSVNRVKIAWYQGDQRIAKFNLQYSTDNVTYTNILPGSGSNWQSTGKSLQLQEFSFVNFSGVTASTISGVVTSVTKTWYPLTFGRTGDISSDATDYIITMSHEIAEICSDPLIGTGYDDDPDVNIQEAWIATDPEAFADGEISDICEFDNTLDYDDGLTVNPYWSIKTQKCVAPGASPASETMKGFSHKPTMVNQDNATTPPAPKVWLIFWGTTWASHSTYRKDVIDGIQNKLLGSDNEFWNAGVEDYGFGMPTWGGYTIYNGSLPANPDAYTDDEIFAAVHDAIAAGVVSDPASSTFISNEIRGSNIMYCLVPDMTWGYDTGGDDGIGGYHASDLYITTSPDPNPPPPVDPPTDPPSPTPDPPPTPPPPTALPGTVNARYIRYLGLGNSVNNWNSITEFEIWGDGAPCTTPTPPPPGGSNDGKPTSYDTGIVLPTLNNNDFIALTLQRIIPPKTEHAEIDNYSLVVTNDSAPIVNPDEPLPTGGNGEFPLPIPPGVPSFPTPPGTTPPPPVDTNPPPPTGDPGGGTPGPPPGSPGTTPDGIALAPLPAGYSYGEANTNPHENFKSDGSFRLDKGVQPQLNQVNLVVYLNLTSGSDEISGKLSGGTHTDNAPKNGRCYDIGINQAGDRVRIRKENPHPTYHDGPPSHSLNLGSLNGKWIGYQFMKWNEGANVHLQCWIDTTGSETVTNHWTKILDEVDTGNWVESPYLTVFDSSDSQTTVRVDSMSTSKFHYKFYDAHRINGP